MFEAEVRIELKPGILDAEGKTVKHSLGLLGFDNVDEVKTAKIFRIDLDADSKKKAEKEVEEMCQKMLANPVINNYSVSIKES